MFKLFILSLLMISTQLLASFQYPQAPNPQWAKGKLCTPTDPDFETYRYAARIAYCRRNVSSDMKVKIKNLYGIPGNEHNNYIIDHIIPLSIGGSNHPSNLWPQHKCIQENGTEFESSLFDGVRVGRLSQTDAVKDVLKIKFDHSNQYARCHN